MVAVLSVRVQTGSSTGSESAAVTGIDFLSVDNNQNSLANRQANPITIPASGSAYSFEKWCKLKVDTAPANFVSNFKIWSAQGGAGGAGTGVTIMAEANIASYSQASSTARATAAALQTSSGLTWDLSSLSSIAQTTKYAVLQLAVQSTATQGNMAQATLSYSYDEI